MQGLIALGAGVLLLFLLPFLIARMKARSRRRRRPGGGQGFDAAFAVFDPAKARALQVMEIRKEIGHADEGDQGDLYGDGAPPADR